MSGEVLERVESLARRLEIGDIALEKAVRSYYPDVPDLESARERFDPFQNLSAHYLLTGARVAAAA